MGTVKCEPKEKCSAGKARTTRGAECTPCLAGTFRNPTEAGAGVSLNRTVARIPAVSPNLTRIALTLLCHICPAGNHLK